MYQVNLLSHYMLGAVVLAESRARSAALDSGIGHLSRWNHPRHGDSLSAVCLRAVNSGRKQYVSVKADGQAQKRVQQERSTGHKMR